MDIQNEITVQEALSQVSHLLTQCGFENPRLNAELLLVWVLSCRRIDLHLSPTRSLNPNETALLQKALEQRLSHRPLQYITGSTQFLSFDLFVDEDVFITRPETEILVETAFHRLQTACPQNDPRILVDVGTGSGNIAIALADASPASTIYATDISEHALSIARKNADRYHLGNRISFLHGDLLEPLKLLDLREKVTAIVCNPPYIPNSEIEHLPPEIRDYEPHIALNGGRDGLNILRTMVHEAPPFLKEVGLLALEVGQGQAKTVRQMMLDENKYENIELIKDLSGIERVVIGSKKGTSRG